MKKIYLLIVSISLFICSNAQIKTFNQIENGNIYCKDANGNTIATISVDEVFGKRIPQKLDVKSNLPNGISIGSDCDNQLTQLLNRYREELAGNDEIRIVNQACSAAEGWTEYNPGTCEAGGPPPICPEDHWFEDANAWQKYQAGLDRVFQTRLTEAKNLVKGCASNSSNSMDSNNNGSSSNNGNNNNNNSNNNNDAENNNSSNGSNQSSNAGFKNIIGNCPNDGPIWTDGKVTLSYNTYLENTINCTFKTNSSEDGDNFQIFYFKATVEIANNTEYKIRVSGYLNAESQQLDSRRRMSCSGNDCYGEIKNCWDNFYKTFATPSQSFLILNPHQTFSVYGYYWTEITNQCPSWTFSYEALNPDGTVAYRNSDGGNNNNNSRQKNSSSDSINSDSNNSNNNSNGNSNYTNNNKSSAPDEERQRQEEEKRKSEILKQKIETYNSLKQQSDSLHQQFIDQAVGLFAGEGLKCQSYLDGSWGMNFTGGLSFPIVPIITNTSSPSGSISPYSSTDAGFGMGYFFGTEAWIYRGPHFGIGGTFNIGSGFDVGSGLTGSATIESYGFSILLGWQKLKGVLEYGGGSRKASETYDAAVGLANLGISSNTDAFTFGYASYSFSRIGFGLQFDFSDDSEEKTLTTMIYYDTPDFMKNVPNAPSVMAGKFTLRFLLDIFIEYGSNYAVAGETSYPMSDVEDSSRDYLYFGLTKTFTIFGGKY